MSIRFQHIAAMALCVPILAALSGCATRSRPFQLDTSTGKPEIVVNAPMKSIAAYITDNMLSGDFMIKRQAENVLVFNKHTTYQVQYQDVAGEFRITYNLVPAPKGIRVMTTMFGVIRPDSAYEQITTDYSKLYDSASNYQTMLSTMKYRLETERPGKLGVTLGGYYGDRIESVEDDGPAAGAGLLANDVIMAVDGTPVSDDPVQNCALILHHQAGTTHEFVVKRKDAEETKSIVFDEMTNIPGKVAPASTGTDSVPADAAINVESIGAMIGREKIISVTAGGPAEKAGLQAGDVIATIDGDPVSDNGVENAKRLAGRTNTSVVVTVTRGQQELTVPVIRKNP